MRLVPVVLMVLGASLPPQGSLGETASPDGGNFDPKTVHAPATSPFDPLPPAPQRQEKTDLFNVNLAKVPEVDFQEPLSHRLTAEHVTAVIARQLSSMRELDAQKKDAFHEMLIDQRRDLQGLPFVLGDACRTSDKRSRQLGIAAYCVRATLFAVNANGRTDVNANWDRFENQFKNPKRTELKPLEEGERKALEQDVDAVFVAVLMQVLAPEPVAQRVRLVQFLARSHTVEATQSLARLALFSAENEVRGPALEALHGRPKQDFESILMQGFRYPLPAVATRAAEAVAALKSEDLVPKLVDLLDEPDPRLPIEKNVDGQRVWAVRELVRINHHRNCMLCHAAGPATLSPAEAPAGPIFRALAPVPLPGEPLLLNTPKFYVAPPQVLVRFDTTYLRQDFSLMQPVAEKTPWPKLQRFDFFVRTRVLTEKEAIRYGNRAHKTPAKAGGPYQQAVASALRELTGMQAEANAEAWRQLLNKP